VKRETASPLFCLARSVAGSETVGGGISRSLWGCLSILSFFLSVFFFFFPSSAGRQSRSFGLCNTEETGKRETTLETKIQPRRNHSLPLFRTYFGILGVSIKSTEWEGKVGVLEWWKSRNEFSVTSAKCLLIQDGFLLLANSKYQPESPFLFICLGWVCLQNQRGKAHGWSRGMKARLIF